MAFFQTLRTPIRVLTILYTSSLICRLLTMGYVAGASGCLPLGLVTLLLTLYTLTRFKLDSIEPIFDAIALVAGAAIGVMGL